MIFYFDLTSLDIQGHLLRFGIWTPKNILFKNTEPQDCIWMSIGLALIQLEGGYTQ